MDINRSSTFFQNKKIRHDSIVVAYFPLRPPRFGVLLVLIFFADSFLISSNFRFVGVALGITLKKLSNRPWVDVVRVFIIFFDPLRTRSSLN